MQRINLSSLLFILSLSTVNAKTEDPKTQKPYEVFLKCQEIATTQYNKSMERCANRWRTNSKERCAERVERVFEVAMERCDRLIEKCDDWFTAD